MDAAQNVIRVGGTRTGKTHLATVLGVAAIHQGNRLRFCNAVDLVNQLERDKQQGEAGNMARQLVQTDAVILDGLGYLPFPTSGGALLYRLISQLDEKTSLTDTTNLCFAEWGGRVRRCQNDHRPARSHHATLYYPGNRERFLPLKAAQKIPDGSSSSRRDPRGGGRISGHRLYLWQRPRVKFDRLTGVVRFSRCR